MKNLWKIWMTLVLAGTPVCGQTLNLFDVIDEASSSTRYLGGTVGIESQDVWTGSFNLGVTGTTSGGSSLPNPGNEASGSGSFFADHQFGLTSWALSGSATGSIDAGLGNLGTPFPTIANSTGVGASLQFFVDTPFILNLEGLLGSEFSGSGNQGQAVNNGASIRLFAVILDGILINDYLVDWRTFAGSTGGSYSNSWSSGVFRLEVGAGVELASNIADASGTQFSSYNALLSVQPIPEPSGLLLVGVAGLFGLRRRRGKRSI
jgi:hypothetical protein